MKDFPKSTFDTLLCHIIYFFFFVLLQGFKKIKLTLCQCILYLDKGLDEMIRIIALEKITFPHCANVFDCIQQPF